MVTCIGIEQAAYHSLVLGAVSLGFALEEFNAAFRERDRYLHAFFPNGELFGPWQKVADDFQLSQRLVGVSNFCGHRCVCPFASNRRQRFE